MTEILHATWGQEVIRQSNGILKRAVRLDGEDRYEARCAGIAREAYVLSRLDGCGITPRLIDVGEDWILLEDLGDSDPPGSGEAFRRAATRLLWQIRELGVVHGDLTFPNVIFGQGGAWAVDWQDATFIGEEEPLQKHERSDAFLLWRMVAEHHDPDWPDSSLADTPRVARRWLAVLKDQGADRHGLPLKGKRLVDLGCFQGDFVAAAAAEGMDAIGIDKGGFRTGENSIEIGQREHWRRMPNVLLMQYDLTGTAWRQWVEGADIALCFSTWPYLLQDAGWGAPGPFTKDEGFEWLRDIANRVGVLYFETQYAGDGPGPTWLPDDAVFRDLCRWYGIGSRRLDAISVAGRPAVRTVWALTR